MSLAGVRARGGLVSQVCPRDCCGFHGETSGSTGDGQQMQGAADAEEEHADKKRGVRNAQATKLVIITLGVMGSFIGYLSTPWIGFREAPHAAWLDEGEPMEKVTPDVLRDRVANLQAACRDRGLDGLIVYADEYRPGFASYLTNHKPMNMIEESPQILALPCGWAGVPASKRDPNSKTLPDPLLFVGSLNKDLAVDRVWMPVASLRELDRLRTYFGQGARLGIIGDNLLPLSRSAAILGHLHNSSVLPPSAQLTPVSDLLEKLRSRKSAAELKRMRWAARVNDDALRYTLRHLRPGMTEIQAAGLAEYAGRAFGAELGSATVIMSGPNTRYPAFRPTARVLQPGEFVMVDFNPEVVGYANDGGVTVLLPGGTTDLQSRAERRAREHALRVAHHVLKQVISALRPGLQGRSVFELLLAGLEKEGYSQHFEPWARLKQGVGHGVGVEVVEPPFLNANATFTLQEGMTLAIKLDLHNLPGGGIRVESVVHITSTGVEALNRLLVDSDPEGSTLVLSWLPVPAALVGIACALAAAVQYTGQKAAALPDGPWATALLLQLHLLPISFVVLSWRTSSVPDGSTVWLAVRAGVLNLTALGIYLQALQQGTLSACVPFLALTPASMFALGPLILGEVPKSAAVAAAVTIAAGAMILVESGSAARRAERLAQVTAVAAAIVWGLSATLDKRGVLDTSPLTWVAYTNMVMVVGLSICVASSSWNRRVFLQAAKQWQPAVHSLSFGALALLFLCEFALQNLAVLDLPAAVVMCLKRTSIPWSILLGRILFYDQPLSWWKCIGILIMAFGMLGLVAVA